MSASRKKSNTDSVRTPAYILDLVKKEFGEEIFDPCPFQPDFDPKLHQDGLADGFEWGAISYVNCPYSSVKPWVRKAFEQHKKGRTVILFIKLQCLGTQYAKKYLQDVAEIRVITKKVKFPGYSGSALFNNIFAIFRAGQTSNKISFM